MAHSLSLVYGSTTVSLSLVSYAIATPAEGALSVDESAVVEISGSTLAAMQSSLHAINKAFAAAKKRQEGKSFTRLFVNFTPDGYSIPYRSEIFAGRLVLPESTFAADWANKTIQATLIWTRLPFWEAVNWVDVSAINANEVGGSTSGVNVYNCNDGAGMGVGPPYANVRTNIIQIAATSIGGDLPGPAKITLRPLQDTTKIYMGLLVNDAYFTDSSFGSTSWTVEWSGGGTTISDSEFSGGSATRLDLDALTSTWTALFSIEVGANHFSGIPVRPVINMPVRFTGIALKLAVYMDDRFLCESEPVIVEVGSDLHPLGIIRIPPYPYTTSAKSVTIYLMAKRVRVDAPFADGFDFDMFYRFGLDGYVETGDPDPFVSPGAGDEFVESWDIEEQSVVRLTDGSNPYRFSTERAGGGIFFEPGKIQYLTFLFHDAGGNAPASMGATAFISYKPRRITL